MSQTPQLSQSAGGRLGQGGSIAEINLTTRTGSRGMDKTKTPPRRADTNQYLFDATKDKKVPKERAPRPPVRDSDPRGLYETPKGSIKENKGHISDDETEVRRKIKGTVTVNYSAPAADGKPASEVGYDALVRRVSFLGEQYKYDDIPYQPLIPFYKHLSRTPHGSAAFQRSKKGRLQLYMPDTIVYGEGEGPMWFYSSEDGYVYRTDTFTEKHILKRLGNPEVETDLVAVLKRAHYENPAGNDISLLDTKDLRTYISNPQPGKYVIQKFVKCKGPKPFICRTVWRAGTPSHAWMISNRKNFNQNHEAEFKHRYCTCTEIRDGCTIFKQSGKAIAETEILTQRLMQYLEHTMQPKARFVEFVADYLRDENGRWWFIQVKAFKLEQSNHSLLAKEMQLAASAPIDDASDDEVEIVTKTAKAKEYKKLTKCKSCLAGYDASELMYTMTLKMIQATEDHLKKRGVVLRWFNRPDQSSTRDASSMYRGFQVCKNCYDLYLTEQKLIDVEKEFARAIGIPLGGKENGQQGRGRKKLELGFVARDDSERKKLQARDPDYKIPRGVPVKLQDNPSLKPVPPKLTVYRLLTYFHELQDFPTEGASVKNYHLEYTIFNYTTRMVVRLEDGFSSVPINKLRVYHFAGEPHTLKEFLGAQQRIDVHLYSSNRRLVGTTSLPLRQFTSGIIEKLDLFQLFGSKELEMCRLKVTLGIVKGFEIDTSLHQMQLYQGIYIMPPDFFTSEPLPNEWIDLIPSRERQAMRQQAIASPERPSSAATTRSSGQPHASSHGVSDDGHVEDADESESMDARPAHRSEDTATREDSASYLEDGDLVPRPAYNETGKASVWCITVQVHGAHELQLSTKDVWELEYTLLRRKSDPRSITPLDMNKPLHFNTTERVHVAGTLRDLESVLSGAFSSEDAWMEVTLRCKNRVGAVGKSSISLDGLCYNGAIETIAEISGSHVAADSRREGDEDGPWLSVTLILSQLQADQVHPDLHEVDVHSLPANVKVETELSDSVSLITIGAADGVEYSPPQKAGASQRPTSSVNRTSTQDRHPQTAVLPSVSPEHSEDDDIGHDDGLGMGRDTASLGETTDDDGSDSDMPELRREEA